MELMEGNFDEMFDLNPFLAEIYSNGSPKPQTSDHGSEIADAVKQLKSSASWNSCHGREIISKSPSSSSPHLISFQSSNIDMDHNNSNLQILTTDYSLASKIMTFTSSAEDDYSGKKQYYNAAIGTSHRTVSPAKRTPSQAQDHLMAEKRRRENLSQLFITLSKVVPGLKKASLLEDAINYLKALQERASALEKEEMKKSCIDPAEVDTSCLYLDSNGSTREAAAPEISARIADRHVLVKISCKKQMGLTMSRIPCEMERINLTVIDMRIMPFGEAALDVTILAEMQNEFGITVKEIVGHLQTVFLIEQTSYILNSGR